MAVRQIDQRGLRRQVVVPDVVMDGLEFPFRATRHDIEGDERRVVFIRVRWTLHAEKVRRGISQRRIDKTQLVVIGSGGPHVGRAGRVGLPRRWQAGYVRVAQVPRPCQCAGAGIKGADHA